MFDRAVDQSKAPAGWTTQNQREYNILKEKGNVKAMWNGKQWDVYSPDPAFAGSAFGKPGTRGLKSKYGNLFENIKTGFEKSDGIKGGILGAITGTAQASNQKLQDNVNATFDEYNKKKKISKTLTSKTSGVKRKPTTEKQLKDLGVSKPTVKTTPPSSDDNDSDNRDQERRNRQEKEKAEKAYEKAKDKEVGDGRYDDIGAQDFMKQGGIASKK
jgi:hypothetical protein